MPPKAILKRTEDSVHLSRRKLFAVAGSALAAFIAGCAQKRPETAKAPQQPVKQPPSLTAPSGALRVAAGRPTTISSHEMFLLEGALTPADAEVIGDPRVTCKGGEVKSVKSSEGKRKISIEYQPGGMSRNYDPNATVTVAWTVRGKDTDTVVVARAFVHVNEDGGYAFGYETPRPTISEMAAPPIRTGPDPGSK